MNTALYQCYRALYYRQLNYDGDDSVLDTDGPPLPQVCNICALTVICGIMRPRQDLERISMKFSETST